MNYLIPIIAIVLNTNFIFKIIIHYNVLLYVAINLLKLCKYIFS